MNGAPPDLSVPASATRPPLRVSVLVTADLTDAEREWLGSVPAAEAEAALTRWYWHNRRCRRHQRRAGYGVQRIGPCTCSH